MMYDERFVTPMRQELVELGVEEMRTPEEVDAKLKDSKGTTLVVVNSICGCAARNARPAVAMALQHATRPDAVTTVFAGQDLDATEIDHFLDFFEDFFFGVHVGAVPAREAVKRAELALHPASVGVVNVAAGDISHHVAGVLPLTDGIGQQAQFVQVGVVHQAQPVIVGQALASVYLVGDIVDGRGVRSGLCF